MEVKSPSSLKLEGNIAENWKKFKQRFLLYLEATEKISKPDKQKVALLLTAIGEDCLDIYNSFSLSTEDAEKFDIVIKNFDDYFAPKKNTVIARYKFFNCVQEQNESIDSFVTNLKVLAKDCDFDTQEENLIRDLLIIGIKDVTIKEKLLIESELSLDQAITYCRAKESSNQQILMMTHNGASAVHSVSDGHSINNFSANKRSARAKNSFGNRSEEKRNNASEIKRKCSKCNTIHAYRNCPAFGKRCKKCNKLNHFAIVCKNKKINQVDTEDYENTEEYETERNDIIKLDSVVDVIHNGSEWKVNICINKIKMPCKIDTGAEVNILPISKFNTVKRKEIITKTNKNLLSYTGHSLDVLGTCDLLCKYGDKTEILTFYVVKQDSNVLIGLNSSEKLGFIDRNKILSINENVDFIKIYNDVFTGDLGKLVYTYDIKLDEKAVPRISAPRVIPVSLRDKVKAEIDKMVLNGVLEQVTEPTDWVHPIVVVQKPNKDVRICMDPRGLNKYIKREHYPIPTQRSLFSELEGAKYFSLLDASCAFLQIPLTERSSKLCTIATPYGRYKFCRLPYGLTSSPEVYQKTIENIFTGINGILIYIDDILVYGKTKAEHDAKLKSVLDRARQHGLKLSKEKSKIRVESVKYLGFDLTKKGQSITENKIKALTEYGTPKGKAELQRFLGIITFLGKFIPNLSNRTGLLRKLLGKNIEFVWSSNEQKAFEDLKKCVTNSPVLSFYNKDKLSTMSVDASQYGLGAVLLQEGHPIAYASSSLTETQQRYSQIEKELLAVLVGCKKFHYYIYGTKFVIETDHKPLIGLLQKPIDKLSPRLQRMVLELFKYDFTLKHVPGKKLYIADALSRSPLDCLENTSFLEGEAAVVHTILTASDAKTELLKKATKNDPMLVIIKKFIEEGWPGNYRLVPEVAKAFWDKKAELHCYNELIFLGNRLVVPTAMKMQILDNLHSAHQGITSCINKAARNVYWPNFCEDIKTFVNSCAICQQHQRANVKESLIPYKVPSLPWEEISIDFMYLQKSDYLICTDYHSKFIEIKKLTQKTAEPVIAALKQIFRTHGIPRTLHSDNGPPFDSERFTDFSKKYDIQHITSSPRYPKSNGMVERAIGTIKLILEKVIKDGKDPNLAVLEYNITPKFNLLSPAEMLMGRVLRTIIPQKSSLLKPKFPTNKTIKSLIDNQNKQKAYYDKSSVQLSPLKPKQPVYVQIGHRDWTPGTVLKKLDTPRSYLVKTTNGSELRRNRVHLRPDEKPSNCNSPETCIPPKTTVVFDDGGEEKLELESKQNKHSPTKQTVPETLPDQMSTPKQANRVKRFIRKPLRFQDYV